jgi:hypothetical protein
MRSSLFSVFQEENGAIPPTLRFLVHNLWWHATRDARKLAKTVREHERRRVIDAFTTRG